MAAIYFKKDLILAASFSYGADINAKKQPRVGKDIQLRIIPHRRNQRVSIGCNCFA